MRRALAVTATVAAFGAVLLAGAGCRNDAAKAGSAGHPAPAGSSSTVDPSAPAGADAGTPGGANGAAGGSNGGQNAGPNGSGADADLDGADNLLRQFDDQTSKDNQTPPDADG